jgi:hypothetical protein
MSRLFTFGCSYTSYVTWPTWSNFLGLEYKNYQNWGMAGLGCRGIAERVAECHARNIINSDDIVIVQWTSHLRHDYCKFVKDNQYHWKTAGSIFAEHNSNVFNAEWIDKFFDESAYIMHSLNAMISVISLLKSTGCTWYMTSIGDFTKLGSDLHAFHADENFVKSISIENDFPQYNFYVDRIWKENSKHWLKPIAEHTYENPDKNWRFRDNKGKLLIEDRHPTPRQHVSWLNTYLRPLLELGNPPKEQKMWLDSLINLKKANLDDLELFYTALNTPEYKQDYCPDHIWFRPVEGF